LNYASDSWNHVWTNPTELYAYEDLNSSAQNAATSVLGMDDYTWDCFVNHYYSYGWSDLEDYDLVRHFSILGWTQESWEWGGDAPWTEDAYWGDLTEDMQSAANQVCYFENTWNWVSMVDWE